MYMRYLGTQLSGGSGSVKEIVGLNDPKGLLTLMIYEHLRNEVFLFRTSRFVNKSLKKSIKHS